ncbi:MAG: chorismate mutase [Cyanobacteria bacterium P01_F01_bin.150]
MERIVRAIRGATTVSENTVEAIEAAVIELLDILEDRNQLDTSAIVNVTFSVTSDIDAIFPAAIARRRPNWETVPLLDVQHMAVQGSLKHCIRVMLTLNSLKSDPSVHHIYLRGAKDLRPDLDV